MSIDITAFHQAFFDEAADLLADFEENLLKLETQPSDSELLNTIFRCAHSIKGGSATFGFPDIASFTHILETLLDKVRNGDLKLNPELNKLLFLSLDQIKALLATARGDSVAAPDSSELKEKLERAAQGDQNQVAEKPRKSKVKKAAPVSKRSLTIRFSPGPDVLRKGADPLLLIQHLGQQAEITKVTCDDSRLPPFDKLDPEGCYLQWEIEVQSDLEESDLRKTFEFVADESEIVFSAKDDQAAIKSASPTSAEVPSPKHESATLRVAAEKLDRLINLVGELVINQSMLSEVTSRFDMSKLPRLLESVSAMERASRELQERAMAIRLVPIRQALSRFPRLVHDMASACGKRIELKTSGDETELDKTLIDAISDPLTHLVRNSIDHGLETPEERVAAGKDPVGVLTIRAMQEGGGIVIEIGDDGRGLDRNRILASARKRGLIADSDPDPSDDVIFAYIFEPGFSTAAAVTDISGRGVGMDIVRRSLQTVNGSVGLTTVAGKGTTFRIRLPLTMAILEGLSMAVGDEVYVMALTSIVESIQPRAADVHLLAARDEVVHVRGEVLPLIRLYQVFNAEPRNTDPSKGLVVIVENSGRRAALLVDELIGQSQVVIKSVEANHRKVDGIAGATILGDGRVALILDVPQLLSKHTGYSASAA